MSRRRKTDYAVGVIEGFRSKLVSRGGRKQPVGSKTVIRLGDPLLEKYVARRYPHTVNVKRHVSGRDEKVVSDGREAGRRLVLHKGIREQRRNRTRLLPDR